MRIPSEAEKEFLIQQQLEDELLIYNFAVVQPLIAAGVLSERPDLPTLTKNCYQFTELMTVNPFMEWVNKSKPTNKEVDNVSKATDKFIKAINTNNMDRDYAEVIGMIKTKAENLTAWKETREGIKSHKYTDGLLFSCRLLMKIWANYTGQTEK